jgi:4-amino-4-deoxy-L-arabinose transferase-like glycosyltransferase
MQRLAERPWLALLVVLGVAALADLVGLRERVLIVGDEALYATAAREMLERGDWIVPSFNYEPRYQKPILSYWLIAASYHVFGVSEAAARLPSVLAGLLACGLVFALGRRLGDPLTGLVAGLVMATNTATVGLSRTAMTDMTLCAFTTAAIAALVFAEQSRERGGGGRGWLALAGVALAGGLLTKGPVAVVLPGLVVAPWLVRRGALGVWLRRREAWAGVSLFVALAAPWFVAVHLRTQGAFTRHALGFETFERYFGEAVSSASLPWWGYLATLWPCFLPWSAFLPGAVIVHLRRSGREDPLSGLCLWWAVVVFAFFTLGETRVVTYVFPAVPALALLVGGWWREALAQPRPRGALSPLPPVAVLSAAALVGLALVAQDGGPTAKLPPAIVPALWVALAALAVGFALAAGLAWRRPPGEALAGLLGVTLACIVGAAWLLMPRVEALEAAPIKAFGRWLRAHPEVRALALADHAPALRFYAQRRVEPFSGRERDAFRAAFAEDLPAAAVVRRKHCGALEGLELTLLDEARRHVFVANAAWRRAAQGGAQGGLPAQASPDGPGACPSAGRKNRMSANPMAPSPFRSSAASPGSSATERPTALR